jgi:hypothetical protein
MELEKCRKFDVLFAVYLVSRLTQYSRLGINSSNVKSEIPRLRQ